MIALILTSAVWHLVILVPVAITQWDRSLVTATLVFVAMESVFVLISTNVTKVFMNVQKHQTV